MKKLFVCGFLVLISAQAFSQQTIIKFLSGTDKDHTVPWDFYCTGGSRSGKWTKIAVPSNWELQGFGSYNYGHDKIKSSEQGIYRFPFFIEKQKGKNVFIVFEGSMTDTKVLVNGNLAGPVHQGSFYRFKYDITSLLNPGGKNTLEVTVDKTSANSSVNDAERKNSDFWVFGGIFRPVYLEIVPGKYIERLAVNARADGSFQMDVYAKNLTSDELIEGRVQNLKGENVGKPFFIQASALNDHLTLKSVFKNPKLWSSEFPNLYRVVVSIKNSGGVVHQVIQKFGFRTVELRRGDGLYINGARIILKGCNRHSFWPESGRTLSYGIQVMDVSLMKDMNMNAVRMSHYPPDTDFLDVCDSLGLYVLDELTGWQAKYDTITGHKLVKEMVVRDVNHPSIIFWDNGNEGGWNTGLDDDFNLYDPQTRVVLHPWAKFNGTDTKHYPDYNYLTRSIAQGQEVFFPTEFMHGLYDGGAGAGLDDFWNLMLKHPHGAGGFIWAFLDEAVLRTDKKGVIDGDGNHAPDGIVGPHREKEASFYTIKEIWSPVYVKAPVLDQNFDGKITIENRYMFTNLNQCKFTWQLVHFPSPNEKTTKSVVEGSGSVVSPNLNPGEHGFLSISLPSSWLKSDALYVTAVGPDKKEIFTWSWAIHSSMYIVKNWSALQGKSKITTQEAATFLLVNCDGILYYFDKTTGYIQKIVKGINTISLSGGPAPAGFSAELKNLSHHEVGGQCIVECNYGQDHSLDVKWTFSPSRRVRLDYEYAQPDSADFVGISFNYPEEKITGMKWLGRGPYRVWKNRLKGQRFGVWHKDYNNTVTGENWNYPEFKGYHSEVSWVVIENRESPFTVYSGDSNMYFQIGHPAREKDAMANNNVEPPFPAGSIGFLQGIPAMGTKFHAAKDMGPHSQKNTSGGERFAGSLWFDFNDITYK